MMLKRALHYVLAACLCAAATSALAQIIGRDFNHVQTGFALTGVHVNERCEGCHLRGVFKGTPRECATCHSQGSPYARANVVKSVRHIPTVQACETCHNTQTFAGAKFTHAGVQPGTCQTCHNGHFAPGKTPEHITTQAPCDTCHRSNAWRPATGFDHASVTPGSCATCHNGSRATGKPAQHMPVATSLGCDACHNTSQWRPTRWNHTQAVVSSQCATCHSGAYPPADGKSARHIPYQSLAGVAIANCDTCHRGGYAAWSPARVHSSVSISTQCASCHSGGYPPAVGKPNTATHVGATVCEGCHRSTASWGAATFAHTAANAVGTGSCDSCHNGSAAKGKTATHIPVTSGVAKCDSCHRSQTSFASAVTMNHSVVATASCKSCHNGSYLSEGTRGALAKPANHPPETQLLNGSAMDCSACHTGTTAWTSLRMNHNASQGNGSGWCKGCHTRGSGYVGGMDTMALNHRSVTPAPTDCSQSGCHRPLGRFGAAYSKWN